MSDCNLCNKKFKSKQGLLSHLRLMRKPCNNGPLEEWQGARETLMKRLVGIKKKAPKAVPAQVPVGGDPVPQSAGETGVAEKSPPGNPSA